MSDLDGARKTYLMLRKAGPKGVHSSEIRRAAFKGAGNPSERLREIADHLEVRKRREHIDGSPGIRAWLAEYAPADSSPVTPASSNGVEGGDGCSLDARTTRGLGNEPHAVVALNPDRLSWAWDKTGWHVVATPEWARRAAA